MIEKSNEENIDLDRLNYGVSEVRPYKAREIKQEDRIKMKKKAEMRDSTIVIFILSVLFFITVTSYSVVAFGNIPTIQRMRNIWIETAMSTDQHTWLATSFFPDWLIESVMSQRVDIKDMGFTDVHKTEGKNNPFGDVIDQKALVEGEPDSKGNIVYANNVEEGIVILDIHKTNFRGKLVIVDDPSRVFLGATDYKNSRGEFITDYLEKENAIVGMNASGFIDTGGVSLGGEISGMCVSQGEYWGEYKSKYTLIGFDTQDRLIVGGTDNWEQYNIRDGMQFRPTLILNGVKVVEDSAGWGLQPRTTIGQCANGVVLMLVVDGRQVGHSIGATMEDCADVLLEYGAVNAAACDGGSSSTIGYKGELINKPSTDMPTGRYLPNAWLVRSKTAKADKTEE